MRVGDLVVLRACREKGKTGVIVTVPKEKNFKFGPGTGVYQLLVGGRLGFWSGNQMVVQ